MPEHVFSISKSTVFSAVYYRRNGVHRPAWWIGRIPLRRPWWGEWSRPLESADFTIDIAALRDGLLCSLGAGVRGEDLSRPRGWRPKRGLRQVFRNPRLVLSLAMPWACRGAGVPFGSG